MDPYLRPLQFISWVDIGLIGLILDVIGALGLAVRETNRLSDWIAYNVIRPRMLSNYQDFEDAIRQFKREEKLTPDHPQFQRIKKFTDKSREQWITNDIGDDIVDELIIKKDRNFDEDNLPDNLGNPLVIAVMPDGDEIAVDAFPMLKDRAEKRRKAYFANWQDRATLLPAIILSLGFVLQLISYIVRNY